MLRLKQLCRKLLSVSLCVAMTIPVLSASISVSAEQNSTVSVSERKFINTSSLSSDSIPIESTVTINCSCENGNGECEYRVLYRGSGSDTWYTISDYSAEETVSFTPAGKGNYIIRVRAIDIDGNTVAKDMPLSVKPVQVNPVQADGRLKYFFFDNSKTRWKTVYAHWYSNSYPVYNDEGELYGCYYSEDTQSYQYMDYPGIKMEQISGTNIWQIKIPHIKYADDIHICYYSFSNGANYQDGEDAFRTGALGLSASYDLPGKISYKNGGCVYEPDTSVCQQGEGAEKTLFTYTKGEWKKYDGEFTPDGKLLNTSIIDRYDYYESDSEYNVKNIHEYFVNTKIKIKCSAICRNGDIQYKLLYKKPGKTNWITLSDYSPETEHYFTPAVEGVYTVRIKAKDATGSISVRDIDINAIESTLYNYSYIRPSQIKLGNSIIIYCNGMAISGKLQYLVQHKKEDASSWETLSPYSEDIQKIYFNPTTGGIHIIRVVVKDERNRVKGKKYKIKVKVDPLKNTSSISSSSICQDEMFNVYGSATGGTGTKQFEVMYKFEDQTSWTTVYPYSEKSNISIKIPLSGKGAIRINVKDEEGKTDFKDYFLRVYDPLTNHSFIDTKKISLGSSVNVTCKGKGGLGEYQYSVYYKKSSSSTWSKVQGYSSNRLVSITPKVAAKYDVRVDVKDSYKGTIVSKTMSLTVTK